MHSMRRPPHRQGKACGAGCQGGQCRGPHGPACTSQGCAASALPAQGCSPCCAPGHTCAVTACRRASACAGSCCASRCARGEQGDGGGHSEHLHPGQRQRPWAGSPGGLQRAAAASVSRGAAVQGRRELWRTASVPCSARIPHASCGCRCAPCMHVARLDGRLLHGQARCQSSAPGMQAAQGLTHRQQPRADSSSWVE